MGQYRSSKYGKTIILKQSLRGKPGREYKCGFMYLDGVRYTESIHVLVARAFIPNPDNLPEVNHKWGKKFDNRVSELEWTTRLENIRHSFRLGLTPRAKGKDCYNAKQVGKYFAGILLKTYGSMASVRVDGYWGSLIDKAISKNKTYKGFYWKYIN